MAPSNKRIHEQTDIATSYPLPSCFASNESASALSLRHTANSPFNNTRLVKSWRNHYTEKISITRNASAPKANYENRLYQNYTLAWKCILKPAVLQSKFMLKGTVSRELRHRLLYIIRKVFSRPIVASHKIYILLKGQFTINKKPFSVS